MTEPIDRESKTLSASAQREALRHERRVERRAEIGRRHDWRQDRRKSRRERVKEWVIGVLLGLDILLASIFFGVRYETISEQAGYAAREGRWWGKVTCALLDLAEKDHCAKTLVGRGAKPMP